MKALTLHQPYATLIAAGLKRFETRTWAPPDGLHQVAIHAAKRIVRPAELDPRIIEGLCGLLDLPVGGVLLALWTLPRSAVLCTCRIVGVARIDEAMIDHLPESERACGHWNVGDCAWELQVETLFDEAIPASGRQRLWDWSES